jgi:TRAP-type C4-dicarboxylate transport system substrate-binding protein
MKALIQRALTLLVACFLLHGGVAHAVITIKIATMAPEGSTWDKALRKMAVEWSQITHGEVRVKIYSGGVAGNETVMLRKIRIGQLHGAAMTNLGLIEIAPSAQVTATPMLIRNHAEYDYIMEKMVPLFDERIEASGFIPLTWADAGWVRLFTKEPLRHPSELSKHKFFAWEGDPVSVEMYRVGGMNPVVVAATDVLPALQSGLINGFPSTPLGALALQWFAVAPNMLDVPWGPLTAVTVLSKEAWEMIPAKYHAELLACSRRTGDEINGTVRKQDEKAIEVMKRYGLVVHQVDAATLAAWELAARKSWSVARNRWVSPEVFDQAQALLEAHRALNP